MNEDIRRLKVAVFIAICLIALNFVVLLKLKLHVTVAPCQDQLGIQLKVF